MAEDMLVCILYLSIQNIKSYANWITHGIKEVAKVQYTIHVDIFIAISLTEPVLAI